MLVCCDSFVEGGAETYTRSLVNYFADDTEISAWLTKHWEPEELQHGRALKAYVQHVWHEFDWNGAYNSFFAEYRKLCTIDDGAHAWAGIWHYKHSFTISSDAGSRKT